MKKLAIWAWVIVLLILFGGWMPFAIIGGILLLFILYELIFYKRNLHSQWRKEELDYLNAIYQHGKEEQYEQKRIEFIANWGAKHDPGSWKQRKANFREWCRKLDNAKWYDFGFWLKTFFSE